MFDKEHVGAFLWNRKRKIMNGDLRRICIYMNGDLRGYLYLHEYINTAIIKIRIMT